MISKKDKRIREEYYFLWKRKEKRHLCTTNPSISFGFLPWQGKISKGEGSISQRKLLKNNNPKKKGKKKKKKKKEKKEKKEKGTLKLLILVLRVWYVWSILFP